MIEDRNRENPIFSDTVVAADDEHIDYVVARNRNCRHGMDTVVDKAIHDGSLGFSALVVEDQTVASSASSGVKMAVEEEQTGFPTERNQDIQDNATDILMESAIGKMSVTSAETVRGQEYPGPENCGTAIVEEGGQVEARYSESPMEQVQDPSDATAGTDLTGSAVIMQDQQHPISEKSVVSGTGADQKHRKYVLTTTGDDPFQSLDAKDKTPPTSPSSVSSCSTLVDPSSRKVSPSDSTMDAEASPTAVKDFAYAPWDSNHTRDPVSIIEENMKLELVRQLERKKKAGERKACREAEKQKGRNQTLSAEVEGARRTLLNREVRADLAKVHANAMILSNVVLRQCMQDIRHGLTRGQHGAKVQMAWSAGKTIRNQEKEGSLQNHLGCAGTFTASAYACTQRLEYATETFGEGLDDVGSQGCIQQENMSPKGEIVELQQSSPIEALDRQISEELHAGWVGSKDSATISGGTQLKPNAGEPLGRSKGKVVDALSEKPGLDAGMLVDTTISLDPAVSEAIKDVKLRVPGVTAVTDEIGIAIFQDNQQPGPNTYNDPGADDETKVFNHSKAQNKNLPLQQDNTQKDQIFGECSIVPASTESFEVANPGNKSPQEPTSEDSSPSESSGVEDVFEANDDNSPSADAHPQLRTDLEQNDTQGTCIGREDGSNGNFEFSEAADPATLWGILRSNRCEIKAESQAYTVEEATGILDAAGPATLWGILRSNQSENGAEDRGVVEEEVAVVSAVPGPATLWGILQSDAHESEMGEQEDADDAAAENTEVDISGPATESGEVAPLMLRVYDLSEIEEGVEVPPAPTKTLVEPTNSSRGSTDGEGVSKAHDDAGKESAGDATGSRSSGTEASPKVSEKIHDDGGGKPGDSDAPYLEAIPAEKKRPEGSEGATLQAPAVFGYLYTSHDNFGEGAKGEDHKTSNVAIVASSNTLVRTCDVLSGGKRNQELSLNTSDISPPGALSQPEVKVCDLIPPISQPNEMSKTQKRKLERRRAAAKKAEAQDLMRKKEEEAAESMCRKEEDEEAAPAPASLAQRLAEEDSKLGEKRRMLQLARIAREEKVEAALRSLGKSAGR